ncbi:hypothetical protein KCP73_04900 [Salmonella enterica subsp. enterica]|nr:hypothetical protein KCP73_04900 [Salmonella enterica subsp. enterica]
MRIGGWGISAHWFCRRAGITQGVSRRSTCIFIPGWQYFRRAGIYNLLKKITRQKWCMWTREVACSMASVIAWWATPSSCGKRDDDDPPPASIAGGSPLISRDYADLLDRWKASSSICTPKKQGNHRTILPALLASETVDEVG